MSKWFFISLLLLPASSALAQLGRMDITTHDIVIEKLEGVQKNLDKTAEQKAPILLRLADLYSDRARLKFLKEVEQNCDSCLGSKEDRKKAIAHYQSVIPFVHGDDQAQVLIQTAHLHKTLGEADKALKLYKSVAYSKRPRYSSLLRGTALGGLGESYFQLGQFKSAKSHLQQALEIGQTPQRGFLTYRLAWCQLNEGNTKLAISTMKNLLSRPDLLNLQSTDSTDHSAFHEDVSRDFATFLAKTKVGAQEIRDLLKFSPDRVKRANLFFLGTETDRLGQKRSSLLVWETYVQLGDVAHEERLEIQIRVAQLRYDLGHYNTASREYDKATQLWKQKGCKSENCDELRVRLRNFVTIWNKTAKKHPPAALLSAYKSYTQLFPEDVEMSYWAGDLAKQLGKNIDAIKYYSQTSLIAGQQLQKNSQDKNLIKIFEGALLAQIEMAETTKNPAQRKIAYENYLSKNPKGSKALEVRYQLAHLYYEQGDYKTAAQSFRAIALEKEEGQRPLRTKAADLGLDSLALMKQDQLVKEWGSEFSQLFPERRSEYKNIADKASLNLVASTLNSGSQSTSELKEAQAQLNAVSLAGASEQEKISYYKNKMLLGEKLKDLNQVKASAQALLKIKSLSRRDKDLANQYLLWTAELNLDFGTAYKLSQATSLSNMPKDKAYLKLAMLAELSGRPSKDLYLQFIKATPSRREANLVRAKLIRESKDMWSGIEADLYKLDDTPDILAPLALEAYSKNSSSKRIGKVLAIRGIQKYPEGRALARLHFLDEFSQFEKTIQKHQLTSRSDAALQASIKSRMNLLGQSEDWAQQAVRSTDWTLQLLTLYRVAEENQRLYQNLISLPTPRSLNATQRQQYRQILTQQASSFQKRSQDIQIKIRELWSNQAAIDRIVEDYKNAESRIAALFAKELRLVAATGGKSQRSALLARLNQRPSRPSRQTVLNARNRVRNQPFNKDLLEELKEVEAKAGGETMVTYIDARLASMDRGVQ